MSDRQLIDNCSQTLAGIKTGNLFNCQYTEQELYRVLMDWNTILLPMGICALLLRKGKKRALIYVFRRNDLQRVLSQPEVQVYLKRCGYPDITVINCLRHLIKRLSEISSDAFPHEIGFFLGYPPDDVVGFIENKGQNYKSAGLWKVYGDLNKAELLFKKYRQ